MDPKTSPGKNSDDTFTLADLSYELPEELIAQEPLQVRHNSRLLQVIRSTGSTNHKKFLDIIDLLTPKDLVIVNDTKVIPTRLLAKRKSGGTIRIQLIKPLSRTTHRWEAMAMPLKRIKINEEIEIESSDHCARFARVEDIITDSDGFKRLVIDFESNENMIAVLKASGHAPLPPYIKRELEPTDKELNAKRHEDINRYQTVFANAPGAVAAPTAGLHFSEFVINKLKEKQVGVEHITLHVGAGTFKPISSNIDEHSIEEEVYSITSTVAEKINHTKASGGRVIAVGTTSLRALESAGSTGIIKPVNEEATTLYVKPGFKFKIVDGLITNFHLDGSSLLVLVATFAGSDLIMKAYKEAVSERYRFYSYGDAMFIE